MAKAERWSEDVRDTGSEPQWRFVVSYKSVITQIAYQVASGLPPAVELNDLISDGTIGLIKAIGTYDSARQVHFSSYAEVRIRGAILDGLRSLDLMPRSLRRSLRRLERARLDVQQAHGRPATSEELAAEMDFSLDALHQFMSLTTPAPPPEAQVGRCSSAARAVPEPEELPARNVPDPFGEVIRREDRDLLRQAIERLPDKERTVINLYYFSELNLKEIGRRLDLSESRICQIHSGAMARIRKSLKLLTNRPKASRPRPDLKRSQEAS